MSQHTPSPLNSPRQSDTLDHLDPSLALISAKLDQLARAERALPDAGFEARVLSHVQSTKHSPRLALAQESERSVHVMAAVRHSSSGSYWAMRLAAAVAIISGIGAVWMATRGPAPASKLIANNGGSTGSAATPQGTSTEREEVLTQASADEDDLLFAVAFGDESVDDFQDLRQVAEGLEVSLDNRLEVNEYFSDEGATQ